MFQIEVSPTASATLFLELVDPSAVAAEPVIEVEHSRPTELLLAPLLLQVFLTLAEETCYFLAAGAFLRGSCIVRIVCRLIRLRRRCFCDFVRLPDLLNGGSLLF